MKCSLRSIVFLSLLAVQRCNKKPEISGIYTAKMYGSDRDILVLEFKPGNKVLLTESGIVRGQMDYKIKGDTVEINLGLRTMEFKMERNTLVGPDATVLTKK